MCDQNSRTLDPCQTHTHLSQQGARHEATDSLLLGTDLARAGLVRGWQSATWHAWFTPPDKESKCKVMKLSSTQPPLQKYPDKNTTHKLPPLSQVPKSWVVWHLDNRMIFALVNLNNGHLILADRFTFENYIQLDNGVIWHTYNLSLWPQRCLTRKACCVSSYPWHRDPGKSKCVCYSALTL